MQFFQITQRLNTFAYNISLKQKILVCFALGLLTSFAMAPYYLVFLLFSLPIFLVFLQSTASWKQAFYIGWAYGFGFFTASLYWISFALHVDLESFWWVIPFAVLGLPFALAFFIAMPAALTWRFASPEFPYFPLFFATSFSFFEFLRGHLFTGFPWNLFGHVWGFYPEMMQITSVFGVYGLSFLTVIAFSLASNYRGFIIGLFILSSLWSFGTNRIPKETLPTNSDYNIILVQPNIPQVEKWIPDLAEEHLSHLLSLSESQIDKDKTNIIIWPETALTYFIQKHPDRMATIKQRLPENSRLIVGGIDIEFPENKKKNVQIYNSVFMGYPDDKTWHRYDKFHLVPFGEYIPFRNYFPFLPIGGTDFTAGYGNETYVLPDTTLSISPLICYEGIFPSRVVANSQDGSRPALLVNLTNDAWYLDSIGPYQHHDIVRFRAVEEGVPLARVANTGISSLIDSYGRLILRTELQSANSIRNNLPLSLQNATIFSRFGHLPYMLLVVFFASIPLFYSVFRRFF